MVGQAGNGIEALRVIEEHSPDLVMLDVQMPGLTGFEVARRLRRAGVESQLVFVTAYDQHAIEAFEVNAVDYLLKPVEAGAAARRSTGCATAGIRTDRPAARAAGGELERLLQLLSERQDRREQLAVKVADRFLLVQADEVVHASVEDDVITVVTNSLSGTSNYRTLDELQARLDPAVFWRVHRSHLVNINKIKEIVPWFSRNYILKMKDAKGSEIPVSRSQTKRLREYLKLWTTTRATAAPLSTARPPEQLPSRSRPFLLIHPTSRHASVEDDVITVVTNSLSGTSNYRTLDELQARLDPAVFWRVHRSHLVNINKIKEIVPWFSRNYILKMRDGKGTRFR